MNTFPESVHDCGAKATVGAAQAARTAGLSRGLNGVMDDMGRAMTKMPKGTGQNADRPPHLTRDLAMGGGFFLPSMLLGFWPGIFAAPAWALFVGLAFVVEGIKERRDHR
ncbi:hypothetical protein [Streptomyces sp. 2A115]|uniref:hypothetical protein n=1 Tax=Streptomyces sp. 2A115 TaxID=3457439 RepID=UPI003FD544CF